MAHKSQERVRVGVNMGHAQCVHILKTSCCYTSEHLGRPRFYVFFSLCSTAWSV